MGDRPDRDMLTAMMDMQSSFQATVPDGVVSFKETNDLELLMSMIRTQTLACIAELMEAMDETGWKPWASSNHFNVEAFRSELIDAFRFWMNLVHISGMSAQGVFNHYQESLVKTRDRVTNGYDGTNKCPGCRRAYDDTYVTCIAMVPNTIAQEEVPAFCDVSQAYVSAAGDVMALGASGWYVVTP